MKPTLVLVHSPLLGPYSWQRTAESLRQRGRAVVAPSLAAAMSGKGPYFPACGGAVGAAISKSGAREVIFVLHSAAGALLAALVAAADAKVRGALFVDAMFPYPNRTWIDSAGAGADSMLRDIAKDGNLPTWDSWWSKSALEQAIPDKKIRETLRGELKPTPLAFFEENAPPNDPVRGIPIGYLLLSEEYRNRADSARWMKWPVLEEICGHLGPLNQPEKIAKAIETLEMRLA